MPPVRQGDVVKVKTHGNMAAPRVVRSIELVSPTNPELLKLTLGVPDGANLVVTWKEFLDGYEVVTPRPATVGAKAQPYPEVGDVWGPLTYEDSYRVEQVKYEYRAAKRWELSVLFRAIGRDYVYGPPSTEEEFDRYLKFKSRKAS